MRDPREFEFAAAKRFSGQDDDSRQPIDNAEIKRQTPRVVREISHDGEEVNLLREDAIDVSSTESRQTREDI